MTRFAEMHTLDVWYFYIDSQGSSKIAEIVEMAINYDIELRLTRVKPQVMEVLRRDGVIDSLGEDHVYGNVYEAAADQIPAAAESGNGSL
jgi:hypothetical protein